MAARYMAGRPTPPNYRIQRTPTSHLPSLATARALPSVSVPSWLKGAPDAWPLASNPMLQDVTSHFKTEGDLLGFPGYRAIYTPCEKTAPASDLEFVTDITVFSSRIPCSYSRRSEYVCGNKIFFVSIKKES